MFLGLHSLNDTLAFQLNMRDGNSPVTPDSAPTYRIYAGSQSTPIDTGTMSTEVDSQTGLHTLSYAFSTGNGFAVGYYTIRVNYEVSSVAKDQEYGIQLK